MPSKVAQTHPLADESDFRSAPLTSLKTTYIAFVQGLFLAAPVGRYRWSPELEETEIAVTDENPINVDTYGKRPCVGFSRMPVRAQSIGHDDMLSLDPRTGGKSKSVIVPGVMNINVCSRNDVESETIAWFIAEQIWLHRRQLMGSTGLFEIGREFVVGAPSKAGSLVQGDSGREWYATVVSSPFTLYRTSRVTPVGVPVVREIREQVTATTSRVDAPGWPASPGPPSTNAVYESAPGVEPPLVPHPLNPQRLVRIVPAYPHRHGRRPAPALPWPPPSRR